MTDTSGNGGEKPLLLARLASQRRHVLGILEGLTEEQLRRPVLPSGWHCLGMLKHLALSDEHYWFRCVVGGEPLDFFPEGENADWQVGPEESAETIFALYREEIDRADAVLAATGLDDPPKQPDPGWAEWGMDFPDVRTVLVHVIVETAVHAGHLDAVRELIDERQWIVL
jgi:Protein of unknown function (DUF664)